MSCVDCCFCGLLTHLGLKRRSKQMGPLAGVKVVDLSMVIAGPLAGRFLADFGAEVIKLEADPLVQPDVARAAGCAPVRGMATMFLAAAVGKRSVALSLKDPKGKEALLRIVKGADVVFHNFRPGAMERLGLGYEDICKVNPKIIYVSSSGFGSAGPRCKSRIYDPLIQAVSGGCATQADLQDGTPQLAGQAFVDKTTAFMSCQAILAALAARERCGCGGQLVEVSMLKCGIYMLLPDAFWNHVWQNSQKSAPVFSSCYHHWETKDGAVLFNAISSDSWPGICRALGVSEAGKVLTAPRFATIRSRLEDWNTLAKGIASTVADMTMSEVAAALSKHGVAHSLPTTTYAQAAEDTKTMMNVKHALFGNFKIARRAASFSRTSTIASVVPPPMLGEHTVQCLREVGYSQTEVAAMLDAGSAVSTASILTKGKDLKKAKIFKLLEKLQGSSSWNYGTPPANSKEACSGGALGPLSDLQVLELGGRSNVTASFAAMVMSDQGASVIKVEDVGGGDDARQLGGYPNIRGGKDLGASHMILNRNKRSVALDLDAIRRGEQGGPSQNVRLVLEGLAKSAAVVLADREGQRVLPATAAMAANPDLIYVAIEEQPDVAVQGTSGMFESNKDIGGKPSATYQLISEKFAGMAAANAATAAVVAKGRSGPGQVVAVKAMENLMLLNMLDIGWNTCWNKESLTKPGASPGFPPFQAIYKLWDTADKKQGIQLFGANDNEANAIFRACGRADFGEREEWKTIVGRIKDIKNMYGQIQAEFSKMSFKQAMESLEREDVGHANVNGLDEVFTDPQVVHDGFISEVLHDEVGSTYRVPGSPVNFSKTKAVTWRSHAPMLGADTRSVLQQIGLSQS